MSKKNMKVDDVREILMRAFGEDINSMFFIAPDTVFCLTERPIGTDAEDKIADISADVDISGIKIKTCSWRVFRVLTESKSPELLPLLGAKVLYWRNVEPEVLKKKFLSYKPADESEHVIDERRAISDTLVKNMESEPKIEVGKETVESESIASSEEVSLNITQRQQRKYSSICTQIS